MKPIMGNTCPDPFGMMLGTGYYRFESMTGIDGLAKESGERIDILALATKHALRQGRFRNFIQQLKKQYQTICIWEIWNPWLEPVLIRYGFKPVSEVHYGENVTGVRWDVIS